MKLLFLHGFPGLKTKQNRELAEAATNKFGAALEEVLLPLGQGLGVQPGTFRFTEEIRRREADCRAQPDKSLIVVGHSWGGLQALHLAARCPEKIRALLLLSPLMGIPQNLKPILEQIHLEHPEVQWGSDEELIEDGRQLDAEFPFEKMLAKIPRELSILVLQAKKDPVTPDDLLISKLGHFQRSPWVRFINTDHQFLENRPEVVAVLLEKLHELLGSTSRT